MRLIQDPAGGTSSCAGLSKLMDALMFMDNCQKDSSIITSDQWSSTIMSLLDEVKSLRTLFRYTEIGYEVYHEFQNLVTKAMFFITRALNNNHLYREANRKCAYLLVDSMEDLRLVVEEIYHFIGSKLPSSRDCLSMGVLAESINYLLTLARMNSSRLRREDELAFRRQIDFLEFVSSHVSGPKIMNEFNTPGNILVDILAAVDTSIYILSEFDPLHYPWLYSDIDFIDPAVNIGISSDLKLQKLVKNVEFTSIAIYAVIGKGPRSSSWLDEVEVQYWDCIIDIILHLLHQETILIVPWKDQMGVLHDELSFLKYFLLDPMKEYTETENTDKGLRKIKLKILKQVSGLIYSFYETKLRKEAIGQIRETIDSFKSLLKEFCRVPYYVQFDHRKNYGLWFGPWWEKLSILIHSESVPIPFCRSKKVLEQLTYLRNYLNKISGVEMLKGKLWMEIRDLVIVLEYAIKPPEVRRVPVWQRILWFLDIVDRIKLISETMEYAKHMSDYESLGLVGEENYIALENKCSVMQQRRGSIFEPFIRKS